MVQLGFLIQVSNYIHCQAQREEQEAESTQKLRGALNALHINPLHSGTPH